MPLPSPSPLTCAALLVACMSLLLGACRGPSEAPAASATTAPAPVVSSATPDPLTPSDAQLKLEDEKNSIDVFTRTAASTVFVNERRVILDPFAGRATEVPAGAGSGFIWDDAGHVVTNFHVIAKAQRITVMLQDQKTYPAKIIGVEPRKDIAVLKIVAPPKSLTPIVLPPPGHRLIVGQKALAIGNPFGLDHTLTTGVVSALGREVDGIGGVTIRDMVQTDAAINPGNSGGPLLDSAGRLIGMNTMIYSRSGASAGIGFAVPVETIRRVVPQIIRTGRAEQVGLGIRIDPQQRLERRLQLRGVIVLDVVPEGPAARAGLEGLTQTEDGFTLGDLIVGIDDAKIESYDHLYNTLDGKRVGQRVKVRVLRGGQERTVEMELVLVQ